MTPWLRQALATTAGITGLDLTLIATGGLLHCDGDHLIAHDFQSHRTRRVCDVGFGPRCVAHCRWCCSRRLEHDPAPFATRCWKGVREIALPIRWRDHHLATCFAGTWRQTARPAAARELGEAWLQTWRALPVWHASHLTRWAPFLTVFADGLAARLAPLVFRNPDTDDLATTIDCWLQLHACLPVTLGDLAAAIGRSVSRTGALVRERYHQPFALVLRRHRLDQAGHLLRSTTLRIGEVAARVGYEDPAYFSRVFKAYTGCSPRRWRDTGSGRRRPGCCC